MNREIIKKLAAIEPDKNISVSLYLDINAKEMRHSDIKTTLTHLMDEESKNMNISHHRQKHFREDLVNIKDFFDSEEFVQGKNRAIAIFSKSTSNVFEVIYLPQPVENRVIFSNNFLIRPLIAYLDKYSKYLAILVDQTRGVFYEIDYGQIIDYFAFKEEEPQHVKAGGYYGYAERHIERHIDDHLQKHYKKVAGKAFERFKKQGFDSLIIAGQPTNRFVFKKTLHPYLLERLSSEIDVNMAKEPSNEVMNKLLEEIEKIRNVKHDELENELNNKLPQKAVLGLDKVDEHLNNGRVQKLLLSSNLRPVYTVCNECNYMIHDQLICPNCKTDMSAYDFKTNEMAAKALSQGSEIHFFENGFLNQHDGLGAILRY